MFDLERAIAEWKRALRRSSSIEEGDAAELESWLRDKMDDLRRTGMGPEEAFRSAEEEFRRAECLDAAYGHARAARGGGRFPWRAPRFSPGLLRSTARFALRRLRLQKTHALIDIGGLALGLTACLLAFLWVRDEISYDRFHERARDIAQVYSVYRKGDGPGGVYTGSFFPLAAAVRAGCPEVAETVRVQVESGLVLRNGDRAFNTDRIALADPSVFKVFTFRFLRGSAGTAMPGPLSLVVTRSMARRYFGEEDPVGRTLRVNGQFDVQVTAVVEDLPKASSLRVDGIVPFIVQFAPDFKDPEQWGGNPFETWVLLSPGSNRRAVESKITAIAAARFEETGVRVDFRLHPLLRKRLYSPDGESLARLVAIFCAAALFVLALAVINFTNLSTARAATRTQEIGIRKTVGARRSDLVRQFLGESVGTSLVALGAAVVLTALALPVFNQAAGKELSFGSILRPSTLAGFLAIAVLAGLAAGAYPAFALSSFRPRTILSGRAGRGLRHSAALRKGLVVFQFALSLILVTATAVVGRQLAFLRTKDPGFERRNIVVFRTGPVLQEGFGALREELLRIPGVENVTGSLQNPNNIGSTAYGSSVDWAGKEPGRNITLNWDWVNYDYFETLRAAFVAGRPFSRDFPSDAQGAFVVNESAARLMGLRDPVGTRLRVFKAEGTIVGVVRDFHYQPLRSAIGPIAFRLRPRVSDWAFVRIAPGSADRTLAAVAAAVRKADPDTLFKADFLDDMMMRDQYAVERTVWTVFKVLSAVAVFIACIGLFGLASFLTERRTKEIGIRKVMGASESGLTAKIVGEFLLWVGLAVVAGFPVAVLAAGRILAMYAYRAPVGPVLFALAGAAMLALAALTVGSHALRVARSNPVESLRYE